jgi:saccharopine dehydrogenase (NAD+, L-lysine-forming)
MAEPLPIVVYGATGFTGRLVCTELHRRGNRFAIAGRDEKKLRALAHTVGGPEIVVADLEPRALLAMAERGRVVLDCAGPFAKLGRPVQDAALAAQRHFLDITGEAGYMRDTFARDEEARKRGVALVNAVGFDVVPTDAAAVIATMRAGGSVDDLRIAFATVGGRPTQGTLRSVAVGANRGGLAFVDGELRGEPVGAARWNAAFPEPIGTRTCVSVPWGDLATAPRSTGTRNLRVYMAVPRMVAPLLPFMKLGEKIMGLSPAQKIANRLVGMLPEGPSDEERGRGRFAVIAEARGKSGTGCAWVTGGDGYDFTAASSVRCAERAASDEFTSSGALTPTQAFGAEWLLSSLDGTGVTYG